MKKLLVLALALVLLAVPALASWTVIDFADCSDTTGWTNVGAGMASDGEQCTYITDDAKYLYYNFSQNLNGSSWRVELDVVSITDSGGFVWGVFDKADESRYDNNIGIYANLAGESTVVESGIYTYYDSGRPNWLTKVGGALAQVTSSTTTNNSVAGTSPNGVQHWKMEFNDTTGIVNVTIFGIGGFIWGQMNTVWNFTFNAFYMAEDDGGAAYTVVFDNLTVMVDVPAAPPGPANAVPVVNEVFLLSADNTTGSDLFGYCNVSDLEEDNLTVTLDWYHDGKLNHTTSFVSWGCFASGAEFPSCGGRVEGSYTYSVPAYWTSVVDSIDDNYATYASAVLGQSVYLWANYTKPTIFESAIYEYKDGNSLSTTHGNLTIPSGCTGVDGFIQFRIESDNAAPNSITYLCYNTSNQWSVLRTDTVERLYEEGVYYFFNTNLSVEFADYLPVGNISPGNWTIECTVGDGTNTTIVNSSILDIVGNISPTMSVNANNFFSTDNNSLISNSTNHAALLNLTFVDDYDLYGYTVNVSNATGDVFSYENTTLSGSSFTIADILDMGLATGWYDIAINITDSHTKKDIKDYKVKEEKDRLTFNDKIKVYAEGAVKSTAIKMKDRYEFEFEYPIGYQKKKVYLVESNAALDLIEESVFTAHLVDWTNKHWIDFEGLEEPKIKKLTSSSYEIEFSTDKDKVKFSSIGSLNTNLYQYSFYVLTPPKYAWTLPLTANGFIVGNNISVAVNVTGYLQNYTSLYVYNSSSQLVASYNLSYTGNGTHNYNHTFTGLALDRNWTVNGTFFDQAKNNISFSDLTFYRVMLDNCTLWGGNVVLTINIYDEEVPTQQLLTEMDLEATWWTELSNTSFYSNSFSGNYTYDICLYPELSEPVQSDIYLQYTTGGGFTQRWYLINQTLTNTTTTVNIYNYNRTTGVSDLVITSRYLDTYNYFSNVIALLQRKYVDEGVWRTVQMDESGDYGTIFFNILEQDVDYKIIFRDRDNHVLKTTDSMKFVCSSAVCELVARLEEWEYSGTSPDLGYGLSYNNETGNITLTWSDATGATSSTRLIVTKETSTKTITICDITKVGSAGTSVCDTTGYTGDVFVRVRSSASPEDDVYSVWIQLTRPVLSGLIGVTEGAFWTLGIMITIAGLGLAFGPVGAIIAMIAGLIFVFYLGIFGAITTTFIVIACVLGIAIGLKVRR